MTLVHPSQQSVRSGIRACESPVVDIQFVHDSECMLVTSRMGFVRLLKFPDFDLAFEFRAHKDRLLGGTVLADGRRYVSVGYADEPHHPRDTGKVAEIAVWSLDDGRKLLSRNLPDTYPITSVAASEDQRNLAISFWEGVLIADITDEIKLRKLSKRKMASISKVAFPRSGDYLLVANEGYGMRMYGLGETKSLSPFAATRDGPTSFAFSHGDATLVRSTAYFNDIELFEMPASTLEKLFIGHQNSITSLAITCDDTTLISGGSDGTLKFWDIKSGALRASIVVPPHSADSLESWECLMNE